MIEIPGWHQQAACRNSTVDFFSRSSTTRAEAKAICAGCPTFAECRKSVETHGDTDGVWAGEAGDELTKRYERVQREACTTRAIAIERGLKLHQEGLTVARAARVVGLSRQVLLHHVKEAVKDQAILQPFG